MPYHRQVGDVPRKRHTQHRGPTGALYREELVGEEGFSSDSSLLDHVGVPSSLVDARAWELPDQSTAPDAPLLPRHPVFVTHRGWALAGWAGRLRTTAPLPGRGPAAVRAEVLRRQETRSVVRTVPARSSTTGASPACDAMNSSWTGSPTVSWLRRS